VSLPEGISKDHIPARLAIYFLCRGFLTICRPSDESLEETVMSQAKRIVLASRPIGEPKSSDFRIEDCAVPTPGEGEVLLRTVWLSLDPYMRGRMSDAASYATPVPVGGVMEAGTVSEVIGSNNPTFAKGDIVLSRAGWQTHALSDGKGLAKIDPTIAPISTAVGVLGMPGMTAYTGLLDIGKPQASETVVVAAASGAVGSAVGQIAKIKGARVVGIAGGKDKCDYVVKEFGFDVCLDHRDPDLAAKLKDACPDGIDVYFENVGGAVFEAVFPLLNTFARVPVCGLIAHYNDTQAVAPKWASAMMRNILTKRLTFRGFIVSDFAARRADFLRDMSTWVREGKVKYKEFVTEGLESAPEAFIGLLKGANFGKQLVRVGPDRA
jgi:NADPH-dependent curcumin reductase CurA